MFDWLVGCFGLNGPLRQYFSLYWAVSQREGERKRSFYVKVFYVMGTALSGKLSCPCDRSCFVAGSLCRKQEIIRDHNTMAKVF